LKFAELEINEKKVFGLHILYSVIEGVLFGVVALNEFVFIKTLNGTEMQLAVLFQASVIVFVFSAVIHELLKRHKKKNILRLTAIVTRIPLLLVMAFPRELHQVTDMVFYHYLFLLIFFFYYLATPIVFPIINSILKNNYSNSHFGILYSYATTTNKVVMMITTFIFGWMLDVDPLSFVYVYPAIGILGIVSLFFLSMAVKEDYLKPEDEIVSIAESIRKSLKNMKAIIKSNKPYRDFEVGFMLYGFSFMLTFAIITLFLVEELNLNYTSIAFYKNSYNFLAILLLPFFGSLIDRVDPRKFAAFTFFTLLMHLFFMGLTEYFPYYFDIGAYRFYYLTVISFGWMGLFAATMSLLWNIGSAYFCKDGDADTYQSVHLTMVGFRAVFAPIFGIWLYRYIGFSGVFALGVCLLALSIAIMFWSLKNDITLH
jgi:Na+/melibiose symporter-like transporter